MKKKVVIALAILLAVGSVTAGSIAMGNNSDTDKKPSKKIEVVSNEENTEEQTDESGTEEENVLPENETEEQSEADNIGSASEEEKADNTDKKIEKQEEKKSEKKDGKSSKKSDVQKVSSTTSNKPSANKPSKPSSSKPSKPNNNINTSKPSKPSHTHNWVASTKQIHHDAVGHNEKVLVKPAWTEKIPRYKNEAREICNGCGADVTHNYVEHEKNHALNGEKGGRHTEYKKVFSHYEEVNHPAQYKDKWVVDKPAWTETVTSYHCSCGAKK